MPNDQIALWKANNAPAILDSVSDPQQITARALQLRDRERHQIATNFAAENFEVASTYVWTRTMALLKRQLSALGSEFIGELLQRPEIGEFTDIATAISDSEAISLALDLGMISPLQSKRLFHSQEIVTYFAGLSGHEENGYEEEIMTREDAISCLRVCVQGVLGHENIGAAEDFKLFRNKLASETLTVDSPELIRLRASPYFFVRTAVSVLMSLFRSAKGAQLEHTARNALLIVPEFWPNLKDPERWQIGQVYAEEYNEGRKDSLKGLHTVLVRVSGFDYVPENLRSSTFMKVAASVIAAHEGHDNFYNEPAPMRELANLGSSIPGPAFAACMTAALCVKLGNRWGLSRAAQGSADLLLEGISPERWLHYFDGRLEEDRRILYKLDEDKPARRWIDLIASLNIDVSSIKSKSVKRLLKATQDGQIPRVAEISRGMYRSAIGMKQ
ncbi:hypothetical protein [Neorhizobium tomejilense]|uniref:hypothetical protein n=1 Tax=Neorhizobium tomejilense TaxID=2093828 RepID=UPI003ECE4F16